ncbi:bifunctional diaminohydroxyphosphoribosylaminopyrimidine deaminase/5-amino-6-(5-phosphoribosylamino)uracil reductase RibD [bacterium]|nr:bifunctional diaminohydroxyphosphoribosylaminopyrimidine deaminase/5-amino-6-(5-phosphoribosylamino)uracil reductase RibD [bacterium]NIN92152.1 bifunctional diaminohydroxyphosphoribosylaminopyrimidine deaminase/5-amino-6-(5-phosphoribosylamino)uracil reductase RibD [bacterium]NIO18810.1 bifunctional diaminohydroxyphosphoribosylaminopyrimidine deaminase/5-amino-6-(5-phosphoribosylamino)uracil reductase RibD [bacterium]NIO73894.1 bifunctional diaminohydroxyphosphoribosylaminopyrimidine deaminas
MHKAIALAREGSFRVSPNPKVGCVLVKKGKVISRGRHEHFGGAHAEINALWEAGVRARGSTMFINLEPCGHYGKTPPCTEAILKAGVKKVVVGMVDPNPLVKGKGLRELRAKGIKIKLGVLREECAKLNEPYIKYITRGIPFVILKSAMSLDGKIATQKGDSKWITSEASRKYAKALRSQVDGVLVGIDTVIKDNPGLLASSSQKRPIRIIMDSHLRIPLDARVLNSRAPTIVATGKGVDRKKIERLQARGIEVLQIPRWKKHPRRGLDLKFLMRELAKRGVTSILIEGGGRVNASALEMGLVDKVLFFIAPKIVGGEDAITAVEGEGIDRIGQAIRLKDTKVRRFGEDILFEGYI